MRPLCSPIPHPRSESQFETELKLSWIESIPRRTKAQDWIRRKAQVGASVESVQVFDVHPVQEVEEIQTEFTLQMLSESYLTRDSQLPARVVWTSKSISADEARTIRSGIPIAIGIRTGEYIEATSAFKRYHRTELELANHGHALRDLAQKSEREALTHVLPRQGALEPLILVLGNIGKVRQGILVRDGLRESVASMQPYAMTEPLLYLERASMIDGVPQVGLNKEVADFDESSACDYRLAAGEHSRLHSIDVGRVTYHLEPVHEEVVCRDGHAAAHLLRDLQAGLLAVGRSQSSVYAV